MYRTTKVATCCYCGTRAALVLSGKERHELACASCGAPLHEMKMLLSEAPAPVAHHGKKPAKKRVKQSAGYPGDWPRKGKKKKKKKSLGRRFLSEAFDVIEDIFD